MSANPPPLPPNGTEDPDAAAAAEPAEAAESAAAPTADAQQGTNVM